MSNKERYLKAKSQALVDNIQVHEKELVQNRDTLCTNPAVSFVQKYDNYEQKDFQSTERLIEILDRQSKIRGTQHIFHRLHIIRNS